MKLIQLSCTCSPSIISDSDEIWRFGIVTTRVVCAYVFMYVSDVWAVAGVDCCGGGGWLLMKVCVIKSEHPAPPPENSIWLKMEQLWWFNLHVNNQWASRKSFNKHLFITACIFSNARERQKERGRERHRGREKTTVINCFKRFY